MAILAGETPDNTHPTPLALWPQESYSLPESTNRSLQIFLHPTL